MRKALVLCAAFAALLPFGTAAQADPAAALVVSACGAPTYTAGQSRQITMDTTGKGCTSAAVTVSSGTVTANQGTAGATAWPAKIDQTTPGTTNGVVVNSGTVTAVTTVGTVTNPVGTKGVDGSTIASSTNPIPVASGGYEFNASVLPTTTNASHAAGVALADLQTISIGSTNGLSGILTQIQYASKGGSTTGVVIYVWSKNPSGTTCTNGSNFVASQTDNEFLVVPPQLLTPALALSAQDTTTYAAASNLVGPFNNGSSNTILYSCVVANATVTPASTSDLRLNLQGVKDQP